MVYGYVKTMAGLFAGRKRENNCVNNAIKWKQIANKTKEQRKFAILFLFVRFYVFLRQVLGEASSKMGKISKRPSSMATLSTTFEKGEYRP